MAMTLQELGRFKTMEADMALLLRRVAELEAQVVALAKPMRSVPRIPRDTEARTL